LKAFVDVDERWRCGSWCLNREAKTMGLIVIVIRILTDYNGFDSIEGGVARPIII